MSTEVNVGSKHDWAKWIIAIALFSFVIAGNFLYTDLAPVARAAMSIFTSLIAVGFLFSTAPGKRLNSFINATKMEIKKVTWPTHKEATRISFIVVIVIAILAVVLWCLDSLIVKIVHLITSF